MLFFAYLCLKYFIKKNNIEKINCTEKKNRNVRINTHNIDETNALLMKYNYDINPNDRDSNNLTHYFNHHHTNKYRTNSSNLQKHKNKSKKHLIQRTNNSNNTTNNDLTSTDTVALSEKIMDISSDSSEAHNINKKHNNDQKNDVDKLADLVFK